MSKKLIAYYSRADENYVNGQGRQYRGRSRNNPRTYRSGYV